MIIMNPTEVFAHRQARAHCIQYYLSRHSNEVNSSSPFTEKVFARNLREKIY